MISNPLLKWDEVGSRLFETGVSKGVIYPWDKTLNSGKGGYGAGVAWSGLTSVNSAPSGAESNKQYADNINYLNLYSAEEYGMTIGAFYYPDEFAECDGSALIADGVRAAGQTRKMFGFCYQTVLGNDTDENDHDYKIHLVYGCKASPSERDYQTVNDSPEPAELSWEITTSPVDVPGFKVTAHIEITASKVPAAKLTQLEQILYGKPAVEGTDETDAVDAVPARLPLPAEIITLIGLTVG